MPLDRTKTVPEVDLILLEQIHICVCQHIDLMTDKLANVTEVDQKLALHPPQIPQQARLSASTLELLCDNLNWGKTTFVKKMIY